MMTHAHMRIALLLSIFTVMEAFANLAASPAAKLPLLDTDGAAALRAGQYQQAITELQADTTIVDTAYHAFKLGVAYLHSGDYSQAMRSLTTVIQSCSLLAPCSYELIAQAELKQKRIPTALSALRTALEQPIPQRYQISLRDSITKVIIDNQLDAAELSWTEPWFRPPAMDTKDTTRGQKITMYVDSARWHVLDSILGLALDARDKLSCEILGLVPVEKIPDTLLTTEELFDGANQLYSCGSYQSARKWLDRAETRQNFTRVVTTRQHTYLSGMLEYRLSHYQTAIKWLRKYEKSYGPTPAVVITLARSYRGLGRQSKAAEWYDRHIKLFPRSTQTQEIMWYRAWQQEERGQFATARSLYQRIRAAYRYGSRAADSFFREGLVFYRQKKHESALATWTKLMSTYPQSSAATAASYWRAKSLQALGQTDKAKTALVSVVENNPISYYAYRARELLLELGDTTKYLHISEMMDVETCRQWLDSIDERSSSPLSSEDSVAYRTGVLLAVCGLAQRADFYLEPVLLSHTSNLALQFEIAAMYAMSGYPTRSYRAARPLAWRIPQEHRAGMPLGIHALLYPAAFGALISHNASLNKIEATLVSAVIRQESIFDPQIVSPVGAIGLMQIMPTTAAEIAGDLGEQFKLDSLYSAPVNIRYGAYYVKKLLNQFEGNIVLALAGYNGGPHNAKRWYERNKDQEFDLFIENIGYTETRRYVKRVLSNYWTYNRLIRLDGYQQFSSIRIPASDESP